MKLLYFFITSLLYLNVFGQEGITHAKSDTNILKQRRIPTENKEEIGFRGPHKSQRDSLRISDRASQTEQKVAPDFMKANPNNKRK